MDRVIRIISMGIKKHPIFLKDIDDMRRKKDNYSAKVKSIISYLLRKYTESGIFEIRI